MLPCGRLSRLDVTSGMDINVEQSPTLTSSSCEVCIIKLGVEHGSSKFHSSTAAVDFGGVVDIAFKLRIAAPAAPPPTACETGVDWPDGGGKLPAVFGVQTFLGVVVWPFGVPLMNEYIDLRKVCDCDIIRMFSSTLYVKCILCIANHNTYLML